MRHTETEILSITRYINISNHHTSLSEKIKHTETEIRSITRYINNNNHHTS